MKMCCMPMYCGGRFLIGIYNPLTKDNPQYKKDGQILDIVKLELKLGFDFGEKGDKFPYLPNTLLEFQHCLKHMLYTASGRLGYQGVVLAVTNNAQTMAVKYLEASGFKKSGGYSKYDTGPNCTLWVGDYLKDMYPILSKLPKFEIKEDKVDATRSKFSA